jgi:hypothetical protein
LSNYKPSTLDDAADLARAVRKQRRLAEVATVASKTQTYQTTAKTNTAVDTANTAVTNAATAQDAADEATALAQAAQTTANGKMTILYASAAPTAASVGDLWIDTGSGNSLSRWDGSAWVSVDNTALQTALTNAATAQSTADGKIVTFSQTSTPTAAAVGDLWVDTDDSNRLYRWDGSAWVSVRDGTIATAQSTADEAKESAQTANQDLTDYITSNEAALESIQSQIDGSITTWFYAVAPTDSNPPAQDWATTDLKNTHLGDLYYDTVTGYCYRYQVADNTYSWQQITDVDVTKALSDAATAQDTADAKRRVFVNTPTPPYDIGDIWAQGSSGDMMVCIIAKTSAQSYAAADWDKASKYTDDSLAQQAEIKANSAQSAADNAQSSVDAAQALATAIHNYFSTDSAGAHVGTVEGNPDSGYNLLLAATMIALRLDETDLMRLADNLLELGCNSTNAQIKLCGSSATMSAEKTSDARYPSDSSYPSETSYPSAGAYFNVVAPAGVRIEGNGCSIATGATSASDTTSSVTLQGPNLRIQDGTHDGVFDMSKLYDLLNT